MAKVKPIPDGYHNVTPYLVIKGAAAAIDFYKQAFGATEVMRMPMPDGRVGHAELKFGDSHVMMADEFPEMDAISPKTLGNSPVGLLLYVDDVDKHHVGQLFCRYFLSRVGAHVPRAYDCYLPSHHSPKTFKFYSAPTENWNAVVSRYCSPALSADVGNFGWFGASGKRCVSQQ